MKDYLYNSRNLVEDRMFDKYLYHYTSLETAIEHILPSSNLRLSPFKDVNDPLEYKFEAELIYFSKNITKFEIKTNEYEDAYSDILCEKTKILCFSQDDKKKLEELNNNVNINLGRGFARPRMWSQYANNHRGVCLVFDKQKIVDSFNKSFSSFTHMSKVNYCDIYEEEVNSYCLDIPSGIHDIRDNIRNHIIKYKEDILFKKLTDWHTENEFRMTILDDEMDGFRFLPYSDSLCAIILGDKFPEEYFSCFRNYNSVDICRIKWNKHIVEISAITIT